MKTYGAKINAERLIKLIKHHIHSNRLAMRRAQPGVPMCVWGAHGIGKTQIVRNYAKQNGFKLVSIAPGQFEEMGDLLGMPQIEGKQTVFRKPSWTPEEFGPGILLLDDFNRADDRIIKGLMPLLQDGRLVSWGLPPDWHIILTANPDKGDYSVTPIDQAIVTRMMHVELIFDALNWSNWAAQAKIPALLIDFVLLHPEIMQDERTTARTLVQFFESLQGLQDLFRQKELVRVLASAYLDEEAVRLFLQYLKSRSQHLPSAKTILSTSDFHSEVAQPFEKIASKDQVPIDIYSAVWERVYRFIRSQTEPLDQEVLQNLEKFLRLPQLPSDLVKVWVNHLLALDRAELNIIFSQGNWSDLLLG